MTDVHSKPQRSYNMSCIKGKNTKPEMKVRSLVHSMGYRFRLHKKELPGRPDMVLTRHKKIIFVHGCFWHVHNCKYGKVIPKTNAKFWHEKRTGNKKRDERNIRALKKLGWEVLVVWECWLRKPEQLADKLEDFLVSVSSMDSRRRCRRK